MTGTVGVIVDRDDDVATTRAIHKLAARESTVLAVSIAPDWRTSPAVIWAILHALGKRLEHIDGQTVSWRDAERWLTAHRITELVMLRAQHLKEHAMHEISWHLVERAGITLTLLYSGDRAIPSYATSSLTNLLAQARPAPLTTPREKRWPSVPRSHPLRLRYDCSQRLAPQEFRRVDELLAATCRTLRGWLHAHRHATRQQLRDAVSVISAAQDSNQAHIRRSAAAIALTCARIAIPRTPPLSLSPRPRPRPLTTSQIDTVLTNPDRSAAGYRLAELITGLAADLLELIGGDQITDDAILGCPVVQRARPVLRAVNDHYEPVLARPATHARAPTPPTTPANRQPSRGQLLDPVTAAVELLLRGRRETIAAAEISPPISAELDRLRADEILELERGTYHASDIALYSTYRLALLHRDH